MPLVILGAVALIIIFLQNYAYKRLWNKGLSFETRFSAKEAFEGDRLYLREQLTNKKFLPLPWVYVKTLVPSALKLLDDRGEIMPKKGAGTSLYSIASYTAMKRQHQFTCEKRGFYSLRNSRLTVSNLLHSKQYFLDLRLKGDLLVFPKILERFHSIDVLFKHLDAAVLSNKLINPDPFEFKGIRDYVPTDTLKSVNFKASAIAQKLMVNIHAPTSAKRMVLVLNLQPCPDRAFVGMYSEVDEARQTHSDLYEQSIRLAATLARHYIGHDVHLGFKTNGRDTIAAEPMRLSGGTSTAHLYRIYECLARISLSFKCAPLTEYINNLTDREQVYLFISPYHEEVLLNSFDEARARGVDALLIVPYLRGMTVSVPEMPGVFTWDATPEEVMREEEAG